MTLNSKNSLPLERLISEETKRTRGFIVNRIMMGFQEYIEYMICLFCEIKIQHARLLFLVDEKIMELTPEMHLDGQVRNLCSYALSLF
jgi:hypothetical protein